MAQADEAVKSSHGQGREKPPATTPAAQQRCSVRHRHTLPIQHAPTQSQVQPMGHAHTTALGLGRAWAGHGGVMGH